MRDLLVELLESFPTFGERTLKDKWMPEAIERLANHLLSNGIIVPPCKVGQTVYCIRYDKTRKPFVKPLGVLSITTFGKGGFTVFTTKEDTWGVTAFATREEAEKAFAERSENGK